jgi:hypothetical protein
MTEGAANISLTHRTSFPILHAGKDSSCQSIRGTVSIHQNNNHNRRVFMKNCQRFVSLSVVLSMIIVAGLLPVYADTATAGSTAKKFNFTLSDVKKAKATAQKPQLVLSWETRVKFANDALAKDAAAVKSGVDDVLARANQKYSTCSANDYTLADLQKLCQPNEGVQACLDRLVYNCMLGQAEQQMGNSLANALSAYTIQMTLDKLKKDISNLENALYK